MRFVVKISQCTCNLCFLTYIVNSLLGFDVVCIHDFLQVSKEFSNWKDTTIAFRQHEQSKAQSEAVEEVVVFPRTVHDIVETLSAEHLKEEEHSRDALKLILSSVYFLA